MKAQSFVRHLKTRGDNDIRDITDEVLICVAEAGVRLALADAIRLVFVIAFAAAALALAAVFFAPRVKLEEKSRSVPAPDSPEEDPVIAGMD